VRVLHHRGEPATAAAWPVSGAVRVRVEAPTRESAAWGVERMRFALGLDHDVRPFHRAFERDRLLGPVIRMKPWVRPFRRPEPFEALAWAITEQLIDSDRAVRIQRAIIRRYGRRCGTLRDAPAAHELARRCQPELQACDLSAGRSLALIRASREVAAGRVDLTEHEPSWRRLTRIREVGPWTVEKLAFHGQPGGGGGGAGVLRPVRAVCGAGRHLPAARAVRVRRSAAAAVQGPCPGSSALVNAPLALPRINPSERMKPANARHCAGSW